MSPPDSGDPVLFGPEFYKRIVEHASEGICVLDLQGNILFVNSRMAELMGRPAEELLGRSAFEFVPAEDMPAARARRELYARGLPVKSESPLMRADGTTIYTRRNIAPLPDSTGRVRAALAMVSDITEEIRTRETVRRLNEELARRVREFETLLEVLPVGIGVANDPGCQDVRVNQAFAEMLDISAEQNASKTGNSGKLSFRVLHEGRELAAEDLPMQRSARENRVIRGEELTIVHTNGNVIEELAYSSPLLNAQGEVRGAIGAFVDITERKRVERRLRESEERFRLLYESRIIGIFTASEYRILSANDMFLQMVGYTREELESDGIPWRSMTPPEFIGVSEAAIQRVRETGFASPYEKEYFRKDGTRLPVLIGAVRLQREPLRNICVVLDLTERKKLERRVLEAQKLESVGLLAAGIAHDFNNLLVGVMGNASLAQELLPENHEAHELLEVVVKTGEQAAHLTRQMLAYSGKGRFLKETLDLSKLFAELTEIIKPSISKKVTLEIDLPAGLVAVEADRSHMQQIFTNLVLNASEAVGDREGLIRIRTGARDIDADQIAKEFEGTEMQPGHFVFLEVADTGCGMDEATKARIYEPFFTTKFMGRGLGLAAVAGIVRTQKGTVQIETEPGKGSCFTVLLPAIAAAIPEPPTVATPHSCAPAKVLVVDDEQVVREIASRILDRHGYSVLVAVDGAEALDILQQNPNVDLVLMDVSMPHKDGAETLADLRRRLPDLPVVVTSGYSESEALTRFAGLNVSAFLQKPYPARELVTVVERVLGCAQEAAEGRR